MKDLNIQFLEKYKQCDKFLRDAYQTSTGVTEYIEQMERKSYQGENRISEWNDDYRNLKHCRWVRNQLAHDVSIEADICTEHDYAWLVNFHDRLMHIDDPLSRLYQENQKHQKNQNEKPKQAASTKKASGANNTFPITRDNKDSCFGKMLIAIFGVIVVLIWIAANFG